MTIRTFFILPAFSTAAALSLLFIFSCEKNKQDTPTPPVPVAAAARPSQTLAVTGDTLLTLAQQDTLLAIARHAIANHLNTGSAASRPLPADPALNEPHGCMVRLSVSGTGRGSSGYILPVKGLAEAAAELAVLAAKGGDRSAPLKRAEFDSTVITISVVSVPKKIRRETEIKPGSHGLVLTREGEVDGILLPQETARLQSADASLVRLLSFANLSPEAWKKGECSVQAFTLQEFQEKKRQ